MMATRRLRWAALLGLVVALTVACSSDGKKPDGTKSDPTTTAAHASTGERSAPVEAAEAALREGLDTDLAADPSIPGEALAVLAPGLDVAVAAGYADVATKEPLEPDTPFRVASMTKTVLAAAVLRLAEEDRLTLDDPIADHLRPASAQILQADGYDLDAITVRQLLLHTAGLFDYAMTEEYDVAVISDPSHRWTREEQLQFAVDQGAPLGPPGTVYEYSDTGYILLGEIVETVTGESLPAAVRDVIDFDRIGLDHTYWEILEPTPAGAPPLAHQYAGSIDNAQIDASTDLYGGGGLVSTVGDLARFYRALFDGEVFDLDATLTTMTTVSEAGRADGAAMGIFEVDVVGNRCYGHAGFWGTQTIHCPDLALTFARTINQADDDDFDYDALEQVIVDVVDG